MTAASATAVWAANIGKGLAAGHVVHREKKNLKKQAWLRVVSQTQRVWTGWREKQAGYNPKGQEFAVSLADQVPGGGEVSFGIKEGKLRRI